MSDEIDPSIAALLSETEDSLPDTSRSKPVQTQEKPVAPSFQFNYEAEMKKQKDAMLNIPKGNSASLSIHEPDLSRKGFCEITKFWEDEPNPVFDDKNYYKTCLSGEDSSAQSFHQLLAKYLNCTDKKDRTVYRQQMVSSYWNFIRSVSLKIANPNVPLCKKLAMRYGVVLPSLFTPEQKVFFSKAILKNTYNEPILYMDEWITEIATGRMKLSTTDEVKTSSRGPAAEQQRLLALKSKNTGKLQSVENLVSAKENERLNLELEVNERIKMLFDHPDYIGLEPHKQSYSEIQRKLFGEITQRFHALQKVDRELSNSLHELMEAKSIADTLESKASQIVEEVNVGKEDILSEMTTLRQMAKMTCGRQGNQFPIFTREFFHCIDKFTGFRENVIRELKWIESLDPGCFCRIHKNIPHRIVPYTLLVPTYGDSGFCWEPFDRYNRITSRGRIVIPMYPRDLRTACLTAVADLRWQVAKEKASFDWMTEGLTGHYYQYLEEHKMKGDIKKFFIDDYILWMTMESNGTQKLEKEVRAIFWRYTPFPQELKDQLKKRSLVYQELYQRDINRSLSDGY
ncbi:MAG: hypothetical protein MR449_01035 [Spirochaetia bacterium]|nr:hypothetical protein [Spirochaetia bacterium]